MAESWSPDAGDVIADKYRIGELIGRGGFGAVYSATHVITGKRLALKWMHPELGESHEMAQRFIREARIAAQIDHPNIVDVHDVGSFRGGLYMVMELLLGQPLSAVLASSRPDPEVLIAMIMPALRGIAAAHDRGIVHRDLKPDNIYLCQAPDGTAREAKVLDFGISKAAPGVEGAMSLTQTGSVIGTPYYMAPEQVMGQKDLDRRTDIYAIGVMLYEAFTGQLPFTADVYSALVVKIATEAPVDVRLLRPDLDPGLAAVVMRAMARHRDDRYPDVESLAKDLEPYSHGVTFSGTPTSPSLPAVTQQAAAPPRVAVSSVATPMTTEHTVLPVHSRRGLMLAGVTVVAAVVAGGIWLLTSPPAEPEPGPGEGTPTSGGLDAALAPEQEDAGAPVPAPADAGADARVDAGTEMPTGVESPPEPVPPPAVEEPRPPRVVRPPRPPPSMEPAEPPSMVTTMTDGRHTPTVMVDDF